jgi:hypothetical protein
LSIKLSNYLILNLERKTRARMLFLSKFGVMRKVV